MAQHGRIRALGGAAASCGFGGDRFNAITLASNVQYLPFGRMSSLKLGNNEQVTYSFDQDYQLTGIATTSPTRQSLTLGHDPNGNITSIADAVNTNRSQTFQYDALNRVSQAVGFYGTDNYNYDPVGNFTTGTRSADSISSTYNTGSNQLASWNDLTTGAAYSFTYDGAGNQVTRKLNGTTQLAIAYNNDGRPKTAATETYTYDGFGKRVLIGVPSASTQDIFDPTSGRLLVENNAGAQPQRTYVYLNGIPIALVSGFSSINYVLSDQLGQPQKLVDGFSTLVWDRVSDPFGLTASQAKGLSTAISLRFPGQEYDAITGLHYNDQRDYDPTLGRYIQSDPIGLDGGINTYAYVGNRPTVLADPFGRIPNLGSLPAVFPDPGTLSPPSSTGPSLDDCDFGPGSSSNPQDPTPSDPSDIQPTPVADTSPPPPANDNKTPEQVCSAAQSQCRFWVYQNYRTNDPDTGAQNPMFQQQYKGCSDAYGLCMEKVQTGHIGSGGDFIQFPDGSFVVLRQGQAPIYVPSQPPRSPR